MFGKLRRRRHTRLRELLSAYLDGEVTEEERLQVDAHLEACVSCRGELEQLRGVVGLLRRMPQVEPRRSLALEPTAAVARALPRYLWALRTAAAATAAALALVVAADLSGVLPGDPAGVGLAPVERMQTVGPQGTPGPEGPTMAMQESATAPVVEVTQVVEKAAVTGEEVEVKAGAAEAAPREAERGAAAEDAQAPPPAAIPAAPPGPAVSQPATPPNAYLPAVEGSLAGLLVALAALAVYLTRRRRRHA